MRWLEEERLVALSGEELGGAAAVLGGTPTVIAPALLSGGEASSDAFDEGILYLPDDARGLLQKVISGLMDATRRIDVHLAIADESIRRFTLAPLPGEDFAFLAAVDDGFRIGTRTSGEMAGLVLGALGHLGPMTPYNVAATTTPAAVLALLALCDTARFGRMQATVDHAEPPDSYSTAEIAARLADAGSEDFRWPLCFMDKVLPMPLGDLLAVADLEDAFLGLAEASVVTINEAEGSTPALISPLGLGEIIVDAVTHHVALAGMTLTRIESGEGSVDTETLLAVRSPQSLWAFSVAPEQGAIADVQQDSLTALIDSVFDV